MIKEMFKIFKEFYSIVNVKKKYITSLYLSFLASAIILIIMPVFAADIIEQLTKNNAIGTYKNIIILALLYIVLTICMYIKYYSYSLCMKETYKNVRKTITAKVLEFEVSFANKLTKSKVLNTVNTDAARLGEMHETVVEYIVSLIKVAIIISIFLITNVYLGMLIVLVILMYCKVYNYSNKKEAIHLLGQNNYKDKLTENLSGIMCGLSEIKMFNIENKIKSKFNVVANKWTNEYMKKRKYLNFTLGVLPLLLYSLKIVIYVFLAYLVLNGRYEIGILIVLISYFETIETTIRLIMKDSRNIRDWNVSIDRVKDIYKYEDKNKIEFGNSTKDSLIGVLEFKDVEFSYKLKNNGKVSNISFIAKPNEITALVGHSGSGKTTIINLLLRKYKINKGKILIDGVSIYDYTKKAYSKNVVGVNQSPYLFNMTIKSNLDLIDTNEDNQIEACKRVGIHEYIMSLPRGYNTMLSENGNNFSGGQRQLLAIARVILSKSEILIFDEITSSLDTILVNKIKGVLENLKSDHTIILITHKKDVMKLADNIIVLKHGNIVGTGTDKELLKNNKIYKDIQNHEYNSVNNKYANTKIDIKINSEENIETN